MFVRAGVYALARATASRWSVVDVVIHVDISSHKFLASSSFESWAMLFIELLCAIKLSYGSSLHK